MGSVTVRHSALCSEAARQHQASFSNRLVSVGLALTAGLVAMASGTGTAQAGANAQIVIIAPPIQTTRIDSNRQIQVLGPDGRVIYDEHREYLGYPSGYGAHYPGGGYGYPGYGGYYGYPLPRAAVPAPSVSGGYRSPRTPYYGGYPAQPHHPQGNGYGRPGYPGQQQQPQTYRQEHDYSYSGRRGAITDRAYIPSQRATLDR